VKKIALLVLLLVAGLATAQAAAAPKSPKPKPPHAPQVSTSSATSISGTAATLNGSVNPRGTATTYHFDYGETTAYGHSTPTLSAGSGTTAKSVSARITGLTPGTTYHFRLVGSNSAGTTLGKDSHFTTAARLTIGAKPSPVIFGSATKISGQLQSQGNAGRTVELQANPFPYKGFVKVTTTTTDALGRYSFSQRPNVNTHYQTIAKGPTVTSRTIKLGVRIRLTRHASDKTPAVGQKVRFTGFACPAEVGRVVSLQRRSNTGKWVTVKQTHLAQTTASPQCSNRSRYRVSIHIQRNGTFRTVAAADFAHVKGISPTIQITVH
jgi:hypothetical protein